MNEQLQSFNALLRFGDRTKTDEDETADPDSGRAANCLDRLELKQSKVAHIVDAQGGGFTSTH